MAELYGRQYREDYLWEHYRFAHHVDRLFASQALSKEIESQSNSVINAFANLEEVEPAYAPFTFFFKRVCYISLETINKLFAQQMDPTLDFEKTVFIRSLFVDEEFRQQGIATAAISTLLKICEKESFALAAVPRHLEIMNGTGSLQERLEIIAVHPSHRIISNEITDVNIEYLYSWYSKFGFLEGRPVKSFAVQRGPMIKSFQNE